MGWSMWVSLLLVGCARPCPSLFESFDEADPGPYPVALEAEIGRYESSVGVFTRPDLTTTPATLAVTRIQGLPATRLPPQPRCDAGFRIPVALDLATADGALAEHLLVDLELLFWTHGSREPTSPDIGFWSVIPRPDVQGATTPRFLAERPDWKWNLELAVAGSTEAWTVEANWYGWMPRMPDTGRDTGTLDTGTFEPGDTDPAGDTAGFVGPSLPVNLSNEVGTAVFPWPSPP